MFLVHSARAAGIEGSDNWFLFDDQIRKTGSGSTWQDLVFDEAIDASGHLLTRPFIETHTHGLHGHSVEEGLEAMRAIRESQRLYGVSKSILSLVSLSHERILELIEDAKVLAEEDPGFLGLHLEGPYIADARCGAHDKAALREPTDSALQEIISAGELKSGGNVVASMTIAAELFTSEQLGRLIAAGIVLCLGHTASSYEDANELFAAGGKILTHTFNAMQPIGHRQPGPIPAAIEATGVYLELIADGHHVHKSAGNLIPKDKLILISDAMAAAGQGDGSYKLGSLEVQVKDGVAKAPSGSLAGSTLTLNKAVENFVSWGNPVEQAARCAIDNPAAAYGLQVPQLAEGQSADLILLDDQGGLARTFGF